MGIVALVCVGCKNDPSRSLGWQFLHVNEYLMSYIRHIILILLDGTG